MSVSQNNEMVPAPQTAKVPPLLPSLVKHALLFGLLGPFFGGLILFLGTIAVMLAYGGLSGLAGALGIVKQQPLQWLRAWTLAGYLYGCLPALATGACVSWFAKLPFATPRFIALTALTGWVLSFLYLFAFMTLSTGASLNEQAIAAFVAGGVGAAAALVCLALSRFLRRDGINRLI